MEINGSTKILGIIGQNISYTLSPKIHNRAIAEFGLNQTYVPIDIPEFAIEALLTAAWNMGAIGFNITTPHKAAVAKLTHCDEAQGLGPVNTLFRGETSWKSASTDGPGFARGLGQIGRKIADFDHLVCLGFGGAAQSIIEYIQGVEAKNLRFSVFSRKPPATPDIEGLNRAEIDFFPWQVSELTKLLTKSSPRTLLVQASSAPQRGDDLKDFVPALASFKGTLVDLVYGTTSALLAHAQQHKIQCQTGLPMLIEQARLAQELWWGRSLSFKKIAEELEKPQSPC